MKYTTFAKTNLLKQALNAARVETKKVYWGTESTQVKKQAEALLEQINLLERELEVKP